MMLRSAPPLDKALLCSELLQKNPDIAATTASKFTDTPLPNDISQPLATKHELLYLLAKHRSSSALRYYRGTSMCCYLWRCMLYYIFALSFC